MPRPTQRIFEGTQPGSSHSLTNLHLLPRITQQFDLLQHYNVSFFYHGQASYL
jgi:hypothetical protein